MPGFNGTGPRGQGPMTGGGRGYCAIPVSNSSNLPFGRGFFCGRGGGRGRRNWFNATGLPGWMRREQVMPVYGGYNRKVTASEELSGLKEQAVFIKEALEAVQLRIQELENTQEERGL